MKNEPLNREAFNKFCHDLRSPLTVMKCSLDLLFLNKEANKLPKEVQKLGEILNQQIDRMVLILAKKYTK